MVESRRIALPAYLVSVALIILPLADVTTTLYPWRFLAPQWRFGAVGLVSNALILPMAGCLIALVVATVYQHRARRVIGYAATVAGAICLLSLGMFALDALQTRANVRPEMQLPFGVAAITAGAKALLAGVTLLVIGWSGIAGRRRSGESRQEELSLNVETAAKHLRKSGATAV